MDDSYFDVDPTRDMRDIKYRVDRTLEQISSLEDKISVFMTTITDKMKEIDNKIDILSTELNSQYNVERKEKLDKIISLLVSISKYVDKLPILGMQLSNISDNIKKLLTSTNTSQHRLVNTFIRRGDPVPFDSSHSKLP